MRKQLFLTLLLSAGTQVAQAQLISKDYQSAGDGLLTLDTSTGLNWLDVSLTTGLSYNQVVGNEGGWISRGFRYATAKEVEALFVHAGVDVVDTFGVPNAPYKALIDLLGGATTGIYENYGHLIGITSDEWSGNAYYGGSLVGRNSVHIAYGDGGYAWATPYSDIYDYVDDNAGASYRGSFLVSTVSSVPEPGVLGLMVAGWGVAGFCVRRSKKTSSR